MIVLITILATIGALLLAVIAGAAVLCLFGEISGRSREKGFEAGAEWVRNGLRTDSAWFGEDMPTVHLIRDMADLSVSQARDNWRSRRILHLAETRLNEAKEAQP